MENHSLIERIKSKGGETALKEIYNDYRNEFLLWANRNHSCTMDDAKDVFQQTVIIFYENIRSGKLTNFTSQVKTYLFSIGKNKILELMRQKARVQAQYNDKMNFNTEYFYNEFDEDYENILKKVEICLKKIGNPCNNILRQYYYHKKSMLEISEELEYKNSDTAKNVKYKCLQRLRQIFKTEFGELSV